MARAKRARRYGPGESLPGKVPLPRARRGRDVWRRGRWVGGEVVVPRQMPKAGLG